MDLYDGLTQSIHNIYYCRSGNVKLKSLGSLDFSCFSNGTVICGTLISNFGQPLKVVCFSEMYDSLVVFSFTLYFLSTWHLT